MEEFFSASDDEPEMIPARRVGGVNGNPRRYEGLTFTELVSEVTNECRTQSANEWKKVGQILAQDRVAQIHVSAENLRVTAIEGAWLRTDEIRFRQTMTVDTLLKLTRMLENFANVWGAEFIASAVYAEIEETAEDGEGRLRELTGIEAGAKLDHTLDSLGPYDALEFRLGLRTAVIVMRDKSQATFPMQGNITCRRLRKKCKELTGKNKKILFEEEKR